MSIFHKALLPFEQWCYKVGVGDVERLKGKEKEKVFLTWKWGTDDIRSSSTLESARKDILRNVLAFGIDNYKGEAQVFFKDMLVFENRCNKIRQSIGLGLTNLIKAEERYESSHIKNLVQAYKD